MPEQYVITTYDGTEVKLHAFLTALHGSGQLHVPVTLPPGVWVGPSAGLEVVVRCT